MRRAIRILGVMLLASGVSAGGTPLEAQARLAPSWEAAVARADSEQRLILAYVQHYSGFSVPDMLAGVVLADADVCALIAERFVLVRVSRDQPSALRARYGLSPTTFGRALLVSTPRGEVLSETERLHPVHVDAFLRAALSAHGRDVVEPHGEPLAQGRHQARRGELAAALQTLEPVDGPEARLLRARILRRLRRAEEARAELVAARRDAPPALIPQLDLEAGRLSLRRGEGRLAVSELQRAAKAGPQSDVGAEAIYTLAAMTLAGGNTPEALRLWRALAEAAPDSPWSWRARERLAAPLMTHSRLDWPPSEVLASCAPSAYEPATPRLAEPLTYLLRTQRPDGSWPSPWEMNLGRSNPFTTAYAAICTRALVGVQGEEAQAAATRGLDYLCAALERGVEGGGHMDYRVWVHAYAVRCLVRCLGAGVGKPEALRALVRAQLEALASSQCASGGWTYMRGAATKDYSLSFVTAAVLLALADARDAGFEVSSAVSGPALERLAAMRLGHQGFAYLGGTEGNQERPLPGTAGRTPACALALLRWEALDPAGLQADLERFVSHREALWAERGKSLMHTGAAGQGSHYLLFDLAHAAEAAAALPTERAVSRSQIGSLLERLRTAEGAFVDTPILGPCVGSGFALEVLRSTGS